MIRALHSLLVLALVVAPWFAQTSIAAVPASCCCSDDEGGCCGGCDPGKAAAPAAPSSCRCDQPSSFSAYALPGVLTLIPSFIINGWVAPAADREWLRNEPPPVPPPIGT